MDNQQLHARLCALEFLVLELVGMHANDTEFVNGLKQRAEAFIAEPENQPIDPAYLGHFLDRLDLFVSHLWRLTVWC
ncbi:hypothetical protein [Cupriavidus sp. 8B]